MCAWKLFSGKQKSPDELLADGKHKAALKGFESELKTKGFNPLTVMKIADIHQKLGNPLEAKKHYVDVGDHYANLGFFNKSVAAFKKALSVTPDDRSILTRMASYNDQVPKYIIGQDLQRRINEEIIQPQQEELRRQAESEAADRAAKREAERLKAEQAQRTANAARRQRQAHEDNAPAIENPTARKKEASRPQHSEYEHIQSLSEDISAEFERHDPKRGIFADEPEHIIDTTVGPLAGMNPDESAVLDFSGIFPENALANHPATAHQSEIHRAEPVVRTNKPTSQPDKAASVANKAPAKPQPVAAKPAAPTPPAQPNTDSPAAGSPAAGSPAAGSPAAGSPAAGSPAAGSPAAGSPAAESPASPHKRFVFSKQDDGEHAETDHSGSKDFEDFNDALEDIFAGDTKPAKRQEENKRHWALFRTMPKDVFMDFVTALDIREFPGDTLVVEQGSNGSDMFLIAEGEVDVYLERNGVPTRVATLGEGDFFGEASLLTGQPRSATVRTTQPTQCMVLKRSQLKALARNHPSILDSVKSIYYTRKKHNASLAKRSG